MSVVLALCASACWGISGYFGPVLARSYGMLVVLMLIQLAGLTVVSLGALVVSGLPRDPALLWAVAAAVAGCLGITAYYHAARTGKLSVVAPIAGVAAGVPVIVGFATGERLSLAEGAGMACALLGISFVSV